VKELSTRQLVVVLAVMTLAAAGLSWLFQRFELTELRTDLRGLHDETRDYLAKWAKFREWEAGEGAGPAGE
jgi:hypothetical protein